MLSQFRIFPWEIGTANCHNPLPSPLINSQLCWNSYRIVFARATFFLLPWMLFLVCLCLWRAETSVFRVTQRTRRSAHRPEEKRRGEGYCPNQDSNRQPLHPETGALTARPRRLLYSTLVHRTSRCVLFTFPAGLQSKPLKKKFRNIEKLNSR